MPVTNREQRTILVAGCALLAAAATPAGIAGEPQTLQGEELRRFPAAEARQGVAVDGEHFYALDNAAIGKYDKTTGERVGGWRDVEDGAVKHLNSCTVHEATLVCAHSNHPELPMTSSVERFDTATMTHAGNWSLGIRDGSLTWAEQFDDAWWLTFANYGGGRGHALRDWRWTRRGPGQHRSLTHHSRWRRLSRGIKRRGPAHLADLGRDRVDPVVRRRRRDPDWAP